MRHVLTGLVVAAIATLLSGTALADNQDMADRVAKNLKSSGKLHDYRIAVKFRDGTAWLTGRVHSEQQMVIAQRLAIKTEGVRRVVNKLTAKPSTKTKKSSKSASSKQVAQRVPNSYTQQMAVPVTATEPRAIPQQVMMAAGQPLPVAYAQPATGMPGTGGPVPLYTASAGGGVAPMRYDQPHLPNYSWPSYASYPNYAALTYPRQHSATCWPYIGPFYPYPQVPLGWRKVTLEWDDGWWMLDFNNKPCRGWWH
jgi:hypothetical protein